MSDLPTTISLRLTGWFVTQGPEISGPWSCERAALFAADGRMQEAEREHERGLR